MALYADRVKETTTTTGTSTLTLAGAFSSIWIRFQDAFSVGDIVAYTIEDTTNNAWEVGIGVLVTSTTLSRVTIIASSNSNAAVSFSAGTKSVWCSQSAQQALTTWSLSSRMLSSSI
jgi:hypothetical protein